MLQHGEFIPFGQGGGRETRTLSGIQVYCATAWRIYTFNSKGLDLVADR